MPDHQYLLTLKHILDGLGRKGGLEDNLNGLLATMARELGYVRCFLAITDTEDEDLKLSLSYSPSKADSVSYAPGRGVVGQVFENGETVVVQRISDNPNFLNLAFGRTEEEMARLSFICTPIVSHSRGKPEVVGVLSADLVMLPKDELEGHRSFLEAVASAIAHQVAILQEELAVQKHLLNQGMAGLPEAQPPKNFVASSKAMRLVLRQARQVSPSRATVLLRGESGTGKELLAEAIHAGSPRAERPLIKLNCAALPAELVESELFGHQKGAFTGAYQNKRGLFEVAHQGTLFLDEIGELSLDAQAKVLRAIQEKEITRVGGEMPIAVDVRLICATHQPLEDRIAQGKFREDLYYRINVFPVFIPSLRERREDILPLAEFFLEEFSSEYDKHIRRISTPAIELLSMYHWPGNVRELQNCVERAVLVCEEEVIRTYHLPPTLQTAESSSTEISLSFGEAVGKFEQELLVDALKKSRGNMLQAARDLRVSYRIVNYKVKKYGIDVKRFVNSKSRKR
ncbi:Nif-specific regulatory protein [Paucidesulfovibrio gracilis DSM 16080]|uniref:Nif-specific regulatory protein n=1 Tax=Paucidesulfovibrio gracilis DSM 16080 TaxID=1121449 RepID=A0A1T4W1M7_9BACT|nr:sigma 54-interacting transcriptional regulator [Paucidesulfovibrio gracilis]SKA70965.1 Nif-specific regulatory protein [Paucidesulfovibrio gracilis DSM 16080]